MIANRGADSHSTPHMLGVSKERFHGEPNYFGIIRVRDGITKRSQVVFKAQNMKRRMTSTGTLKLPCASRSHSCILGVCLPAVAQGSHP